jgi:acyl-CoA thioester hydrolase
MTHECSLGVRTYECDAYGHVNNAVYLHYLEYGRSEFLKAAGFDYPAVIAAGYGLYVVRVEIDFKRSAIFDDQLLIRSWPIKKGAVSGMFGQQILRAAEMIVDAKVSWAFVDQAGKPTRIPSPWDLPGLYPS